MPLLLGNFPVFGQERILAMRNHQLPPPQLSLSVSHPPFGRSQHEITVPSLGASQYNRRTELVDLTLEVWLFGNDSRSQWGICCCYWFTGYVWKRVAEAACLTTLPALPFALLFSACLVSRFNTHTHTSNNNLAISMLIIEEKVNKPNKTIVLR